MLIGAILYISIRHIVLKQVSQALLTEKQIIREQLEYTDTIPDFSEIFNHQIEVTIYKHRIETSEVFKDTLLNDTINKGQAEYRFLIFKSNTHDNRGFVIKTSQSIQEEKKLLYEILGTIIMSFVLLSLLLIFILFSISRGLWDTFFKTLFRIRHFDVKTNGEFIPVDTRISEFKELNNVLKLLTDKIRSDYLSLKEFSENASHEIQTPLAVIRMRIDQILQSAGINDELAANLVAINQSVSKISRINQALTLISKIENSQFSETKTVNFNHKIQEVLDQFHDFILARRLKSSFESAENVDLQINPDLADFMLTNLIGNAIRHNVEKGWISIRLSRDELVFKNSGEDLKINPGHLFRRFSKAGPDKTSLDLDWPL